MKPTFKKKNEKFFFLATASSRIFELQRKVINQFAVFPLSRFIVQLQMFVTHSVFLTKSSKNITYYNTIVIS